MKAYTVRVTCNECSETATFPGTLQAQSWIATHPCHPTWIRR